MAQVIIDYDEYQELLKREKIYFVTKQYEKRIEQISYKNEMTFMWEKIDTLSKSDITEMLFELFGKNIRIL